jgi:hypothetical protein
MRYRKLSKEYDYTFGRGLHDFYIDVPDAPGQAILTRLQMYEGEWFLDKSAGTPWNTKVLGLYTGLTRDPVVRNRVGKTQGVNRIVSYSSDLNRDLRSFSVEVQVETIYGDATMMAILAATEPK